MAEATKSIDMSVPCDKLWNVIVDYEKYNEFVDGVQTVNIKSRSSGKTQVEYRIQLLGKDVFYVLNHNENASAKGPSGDLSMTWDLVESNILKANSGSWTLRDLGGGRTSVTYSLSLEFKIYVPGMILNGLVKSSLPKMLENFEHRAKTLKG